MPWDEQVAPAHNSEFMSSDIDNEQDRIQHDGFKVLVSKAYLGGDELHLAHPTMSFTFLEKKDKETGTTVSQSIISFLLKRPNGIIYRTNYTHTSLEAMTFLDISRDSKLSGAFCLSLSVPTAISLQEATGKGSLHDKLETGDVPNFNGVKKNLYVVLRPWLDDKYVKRGLKKEHRDLGDYDMLLRAGEYFEGVRRNELNRLAYNKIIFRRDRAPNLVYCEKVGIKEWLEMLKHDGLTTSEDVDHRNFIYIVQRPADEATPMSENSKYVTGHDPALPSGSASGDFHHSPLRPGAKMTTSSPLKPVVMRSAQPATPGTAAVGRSPVMVPRGVLLAHDGRPSTTAARAVVVHHSPVTPSTSANTPRLNTSAISNNSYTPGTSNQQETPKTAPSGKTSGTAVAIATIEDGDLKESSAASSKATSSKSSSEERNSPEPPPPQVVPSLAPLSLATFDGTTTLLHYPVKAAQSDGITIKFKDMGRLSLGEMLNDTIVEFGIRYILYHLLKKEQRDKVHSVGTFFYSSFATGQQNDKNNNLFHPNNAVKRKQHLAKNYAKVRRWTRKVDIFKKDFIILPVNNEMHWFLIIVAYPGRALKDKSEPEVVPTSADEMCQVFVFDSLRDPDEPKRACSFPIMRDYLQFEFEDKKVKKEPNLRFSPQHVCPVYFQGLPQQTNLVDCGVYLLAYLEAFLVTKIPKVPEDKLVESSDWLPWLRVGIIEFYRDKILHRIKSQCDEEIWDAFEKYEALLGKDQPKVTIHKESDLVDFRRRPRRHEDYCCPDKLPVEPRRDRGVSLPPPTKLVPGLDRVAHKYT